MSVSFHGPAQLLNPHRPQHLVFLVLKPVTLPLVRVLGILEVYVLVETRLFGRVVTRISCIQVKVACDL